MAVEVHYEGLCNGCLFITFVYHPMHSTFSQLSMKKGKYKVKIAKVM